MIAADPSGQLPLALPARAALGREDFVVAPSNAAALAMIDGAPRWPGGKLRLTGPEASGKTHLAHVWAARVDAVVVTAAELPRLDIPTLAAAGHVAVEDVPAIAGDRTAEASLFHLHNLTLAEGGRLLLTGRDVPRTCWGIRLPDLASRLQATTMVALETPDDTLLAALLRKHFRDRQLDLPATVLAYLLRRMDRSGAAAGRLALAIDRLTLARQSRVTVPLARAALGMAATGTSRKDHDEVAGDAP